MPICIDCGKETKVSTRCSSCAAKLAWKTRKRPPKNRCVDCNKIIDAKATRCWNCALEAGTTGRPQSIPRRYCIDCGREITGQRRCLDCFRKYQKSPEFKEVLRENALNWHRNAPAEEIARWRHNLCCERATRRRPKKYCPDCGKEIGWESTRCHNCAMQSPEVRQRQSKAIKAYYRTHDGSGKGRHPTQDTLQKLSQVRKDAWARGIYDNAYKSPSQPELVLMAALNELGIEYIPQYRIETYPYDVYLPDHNLLIEYDGWYWHHSEWAIEHGVPKRDMIKNRLANEANLQLIRLTAFPERDLTYDEIYNKLSGLILAGNHPERLRNVLVDS